MNLNDTFLTIILYVAFSVLILLALAGAAIVVGLALYLYFGVRLPGIII